MKIIDIADIQIRPAKLEELARVKYVTKLAYDIPYKENTLVTKPHESEDLEDKFKNKEIYIIVAILDGKIVGAVRYEITKNNRLYFNKLAVLKSDRKKGIGSRLVKEMEKIAKLKNCLAVTLDCLKEKKLDEYYQNLGYKIESTKKHLDFHEVYMSKEIK